MPMNELTQKVLKKLLHYDPDTGYFTWLIKPSQCVCVGDSAGCIDTKGYRVIQILGKPYKAHRLAFLYMTGKFPLGCVDHNKHIRDDNQWLELSDITLQDNSKNASQRKDNTSGITGVYWNKRDKAWYAYIGINGKLTYLGYFSEFKDAVKIRKLAEIKQGFHENHGIKLEVCYE